MKDFRQERDRDIMKRRIIWMAADIGIAALIVLAVYAGNYLMPQKGQKAASMNIEAVQDSSVQTSGTIADVAEETGTLPKMEGMTGLAGLEAPKAAQDQAEVYPFREPM